MRYDAFISYSHSGDDLLSERVQNGLQRFATPWWRRRALSVFRDRTGLSANPGLWTSIADAIDESRFFLLLASPEAAASPWVTREIAQWRAQHGSDHLLVLLTDGEVVWDNAANDFDWHATTALNATAFAGCFLEEPRHVDMRWARSEVQLDLTDGRFRDQIAELAAPVHGLAKDELAGEDVRQHRRTLRHAFAAGVALAALTLAAVATSAFALEATGSARRSERRAIEQEHRADKEAGIASAERTDAEHQKTIADHNAEQARLSALDATREKRNAQSNATLAESQRRLAVLNARQADANARQADANARQAQANLDLAVAGQFVIADQNGQLRQANGQLETLNGALTTEKQNLTNANTALVSEEQRTRRQRLAGVARQLALGSAATLQAGQIDRALLLAGEARTFGDRSTLIPSDSAVQPLVDALQRDPELVTSLRGLGGQIGGVAVSPDGTRAAAMSEDGHVGIWRLKNQRLQAGFATSPDANGFLFTDSNTLVVSRSRVVSAYRPSGDGTSWKPAWTVPFADPIRGVATSRSGVIAVGVAGDTAEYVQVLDARDGGLGAHVVIDGVIDALAVSRDGHIAVHLSTSEVDTAIRIFDRTGAGDHSMDAPGLSYSPWPLGFSADGTRVAAVALDLSTSKLSLHRFDLALTHDDALPIPEPAPNAFPSPLAVAPDLDHVLLRYGPNEGLVGIASVSSGRFVGGLDAPVPPSSQFGANGANGDPAVFTPDGSRFMTSGGSSGVPLFTMPGRNRSQFARFDRLTGLGTEALAAAAIAPDNKVLVSITNPSATSTMHITSLASGTRRDVRLGNSVASTANMFGFGLGGGSVTFGDRAQEVAIAFGDGSIDFRSTKTGQRLLHLGAPAPSLSLPQISFAGTLADGRVAEAFGKITRVWDLRGGHAAGWHDIATTDDETRAAVLAASGRRLVTATLTFAGSNPVVHMHVFDDGAHGWTETRSFRTAVAFPAVSPDGHQLVQADGGKVTSYNLDTGALTWRKRDHDSWDVWSVDGKQLLSFALQNSTPVLRTRSPEDGSVRISLQAVRSDESGTSTPIAIGSSGGHVALADMVTPDEVTFSFGVTSWRTGLTDLRTAACHEAGRNLTHQEWTQYVGGFDDYERTCSNLP